MDQTGIQDYRWGWISFSRIYVLDIPAEFRKFLAGDPKSAWEKIDRSRSKSSARRNSRAAEPKKTGTELAVSPDHVFRGVGLVRQVRQV